MSNGFVLPEVRRKLLPLIELAVAKFSEGDWLTLGARTGCLDMGAQSADSGAWRP